MIDVYDAIARMMPYAKGVSAKSYDFDASGRETKLDFARILKIVTDAGYHGFVGIEFEGARLSASRRGSRRPRSCWNRSEARNTRRKADPPTAANPGISRDAGILRRGNARRDDERA